jgi:hypothetical protein
VREILLLDFISHSYNCLYSTQYYSSNTVLIARSVFILDDIISLTFCCAFVIVVAA